MRYEPIDKELFINNRKRLVSELKPGSLAVFNSNDTMPTNADGTMPYRQNNDLFYLTGIEQEESILLICPSFREEKRREILFLRQPNEHLEKWYGHKLTKEEAKAISGIETVMWLQDFENLFHHFMVMGGVEFVYLNTNEHYRAEIVVQTRDARFIDSCQAKYPLHTYQRIAPIMSKLRRIKQKQEIDLIQRACDITEKGFRRVLKFVKPGVTEYEIEAEYVHEFISNGSKGFAYTPIIASGKNNIVLHYIENSLPCKDGELVLLDVAAVYANYNSDLTRTIPVSGRFTARQKEVYNAVLRVQREAMKLLRPDIIYFDYQKEIEKIMEGELVKLRLITDVDIKNQDPENPALRKYFYHGTSHMLGLDVHDIGNMHDRIQVGSVWTIEPGIYIKEEGFGVRLENNIWGFNLRDASNKSRKDLIQYLVKAAGYGANFLLNVGPMPNGKIQPEHVELLKQMGDWTKQYGETIYGTRGGPLSAREWGVMTQKGNKIYVHILNWQDETLTLPKLGKKIVSAKLFIDKTPIKFLENDFGLSLQIPKTKMDDVDTVVELEVK